MTKRRAGQLAGEPSKTSAKSPRPQTVHSSVYLPTAVYEALREVAFKERLKIHDIVVEGIGLALRKRGYPSIDDLKAGKI